MNENYANKNIFESYSTHLSIGYNRSIKIDSWERANRTVGAAPRAGRSDGKRPCVDAHTDFPGRAGMVVHDVPPLTWLLAFVTCGQHQQFDWFFFTEIDRSRPVLPGVDVNEMNDNGLHTPRCAYETVKRRKGATGPEGRSVRTVCDLESLILGSPDRHFEVGFGGAPATKPPRLRT